jgi:predicted RNase H-like HicB family nuclease
MIALRPPIGPPDSQKECTVERIVTLHIEKLPEGVYLATSDDIQGLVAQGRTIQETVEIAHDVANKAIELQSGGSGAVAYPPAKESFDYPLIVNA